MASPEVLFVAFAVCLGAFVQGLAGLGFLLASSPVVTQIVPGTGAVGLVNALSVLQNVWLIVRTRGRIEWRILAAMAPGLILGFVLGWIAVRLVPISYLPLIVAISASASVLWLLAASRFAGHLAGFFSATWGSAVNTVAGVGGPPIASYLITRGLAYGTYIRTLQVTFAIIDIASLPVLGIYAPSIPAVGVWIAALILGSIAGERLRRHLRVETAERVGKLVVVSVCVIAVARSVWTLVLA